MVHSLSCRAQTIVWSILSVWWIVYTNSYLICGEHYLFGMLVQWTMADKQIDVHKFNIILYISAQIERAVSSNNVINELIWKLICPCQPVKLMNKIWFVSSNSTLLHCCWGRRAGRCCTHQLFQQSIKWWEYWQILENQIISVIYLWV